MSDQKREYEDTLSVGKVLKDEFFSNNELTTRLREVLATRKAAHARWYVTGGNTKKNRKALGDADDALELLVHAECYDIADEIDRLNADRDDWKETDEDTRREYQAEHTAWRERNGALRTKADALAEAATAIEPYLDAIICYASTTGEHEPNKIAKSFRAALTIYKEKQ